MKDQTSLRYSRYVLIMLTATYTCSYLDRYVLSVLAEPIKADLGISDTQLGLLGGLAFALLYTFAGIPIARLADRGNRRTIIASGLAVWSFMTVCCGFVKSFPQLLLARIGVGLGEAACTPPSHSLIADYFPPEKRATALSIYSMAIPTGVMLGFLAGGWITYYFDWRTAFVVVGAPGLLLALLVRFTIKEPERGRMDTVGQNQADFSLKEAVDYIVKNRALTLLQVGGAFYSLAGYGISFWVAPFFARVHNLPLEKIATWLAVGAFVGGIGGAYASGRIADYYGRRGLHGYLMTLVVALFIGIPLTGYMLLVGNTQIAIALFFVQQLSFAFYPGPIYATMQFMVPAKMRALIVAIHLFVLNLVGLGLGPLVIGMLSDHWTPIYGEAWAIKMALLVILAGGLAGVFVIFIAALKLKNDKNKLATAQA